MIQGPEPLLKVVRGGGRDVQVYLSAEDGTAEDLTSATAGTLTVSSDDTLDPALVKDLAIDHGLNCVKCTLSPSDTASLPVGLLVAEVDVTISGTSYKSVRFNVDVAEALR